MCGIVGYIGKKSAIQLVMDGLKAMEYRGYDSAGITILQPGKPITIKRIGHVAALDNALKEEDLKDQGIAIGHTRWATHGGVTEQNAHPHFNTDKTIFVVHNGIIENYEELRDKLQHAGYKFATETDSEVIPQLIDYYLKQVGSPKQAFEAAIRDLVGAYAIAALFTEEPESIYAARLSSPLVIGVGHNEHFIASDPTAMMEHTKKVIFLDDYEVAHITKDDAQIHNIKKSASVQRAAEELDYEQEKVSLEGFPHFMLKEIHEAPQTLKAAIRGRIKPETNTVKLGGLESVSQQLQFIDRIVIIACGTSYYAGLVGEYLIEEIAGIPVEVQLSSEFKYRHEPFSRSSVIIAISQSGETADTIAALKKVENYGVLRLGIVNAVGSTIARMTDAGVYCHAGPEMSVASTKAFIAQVAVLADIALYLSQGRSPLYKPMIEELSELPKKAAKVLEQADKVERVAKKYAKARDFMYIGRTYAYPCAMEGALKVKELSYIHAEGCAGGEMKHGPIAMIDKDFPTFAIATKSPLLEKTLSNIEEIKARKGPVVAIATEGDKQVTEKVDDVIYVPDTLEQLQPLLNVIVLQLFAYYVTIEKGLNVDRPRNLAKSVTVE